MTLPFSNANRNKRVFSCFVCGREFKELEEFKTHIVETHDEGREYLSCPCCDHPVRDMAVHFKALHPRDKVPAGIQTKVLVWHDFSTRKKKKKQKFHSGSYVSMKNHGKLLNYRSGWELQVYECLEELQDVARFDVETIKLPYFWSLPGQAGKWRDYIPDIVGEYVDGRKEIWEIKPKNQTDLEKNKAKWDACAKFCTNHGYRFVVQTEVGLNKLKQQLLNEKRTS